MGQSKPWARGTIIDITNLRIENKRSRGAAAKKLHARSTSVAIITPEKVRELSAVIVEGIQMGRRRRKIKIKETLAELEPYRWNPFGAILLVAKEYAGDPAYTVARIAGRADVEAHQVRHALDLYDQHGISIVFRTRGRKPKPEQTKRIVALIRQLAGLRGGKPTVKPTEVLDLLLKNYRIKLSRRSLAFYRKEAGFNWRARGGPRRWDG